MAKGKRSFFERLTGTVSIDDYDDVFEGEEYQDEPVQAPVQKKVSRTEQTEPEAQQMQQSKDDWMEEESGDGQLAVDVYQTADNIVIQAHVAGVHPNDLDISITRDMITIKGKREEAQESSDENYFYKELYWGSFSRTILLPQEIEVEESTAQEKHGFLILTLPKVDKEKQTKLKVKSS